MRSDVSRKTGTWMTDLPWRAMRLGSQDDPHGETLFDVCLSIGIVKCQHSNSHAGLPQSFSISKLRMFLSFRPIMIHERRTHFAPNQNRQSQFNSA